MAKKLDDVAVDVSNDDRFDRFNAAEERLSKGKTALPSISPTAVPVAEKERRNSSVSMPRYVWKNLGDAAHADDVPQNIYVMKALKAYGIEIDEEDLIDPRKTRNSKK